MQSVAVRMICDREEEINKFVPEEYWNLVAQFEGSNPPPFEAKLLKIDGKKAKVINGEQAAKLAAEIQKADFIVEKLEKKELKRSALPPFTTSKLQQEASRWLRFSAKKTMSVAQKLYEGIELGKEGSVGLITYMRTDSYRIADEALTRRARLHQRKLFIRLSAVKTAYIQEQRKKRRTRMKRSVRQAWPTSRRILKNISPPINLSSTSSSGTALWPAR